MEPASAAALYPVYCSPFFLPLKFYCSPSPAAARITRAEQVLLNIEQQREGGTGGERLSARDRGEGGERDEVEKDNKETKEHLGPKRTARR